MSPTELLDRVRVPESSLYVSRRDRFRENLKGVLDPGSRLLCGAENSFRVNPSSLVNSGAVVRRIRAAKLSEIGAFSTRCRRRTRIVRTNEESSY